MANPLPTWQLGDVFKHKGATSFLWLECFNGSPLPSLFPNPHSSAWYTRGPSSPLPGAHATLVLLNYITLALCFLLSSHTASSTISPTPNASHCRADSSSSPRITFRITLLHLPSLGHVSLLDAPIQTLGTPIKGMALQWLVWWSHLLIY